MTGRLASGAMVRAAGPLASGAMPACPSMWRWLRWAWLALSLLIMATAQVRAAPGLAPAQAGLVEIDRAELTPGRVMPGDEAGHTWQAVTLDHPWRMAGWCDAPVSTYRVSFEWQGRGGEADLGLLVHRAGNRLAVWFNGSMAAQFGRLDQADADHADRPLLVRLSATGLKAGRNTLLLQVAGNCLRHAGLSQVSLGRLDEVSQAHGRATRLNTYPTVVGITLGALMALGSGLYAWLSPSGTARRLGWASLMWLAAVLLGRLHELPVPYALWAFGVDTAHALWGYIVAGMFMRLSGACRPWQRRLQDVTLALYLMLSLLAMLGAWPALKSVGAGLAIVVHGFFVAWILWHTWREPTVERRIVSIAIVPLFALAVLNLWRSWLSSDPQTYRAADLSPWLAVLLLVTLGLMMARNFRKAMRADQHYRQELEEEVRRQRQELARHFLQEQERAKAAAVMAERQRIVRDMHDGLGSQLVGMLATVRQEAEPPAHLEDDLTQAMEQLRATMDSLNTTEQDLSTVLAQFRFHHEPRLQRAGMQLNWQVQAMPGDPWPPAAVWELQQMLREVFANILKHARARRITVKAGTQEGWCLLGIADDGQGFLPSQPGPSGRGLRHLKERAAQLGITLRLDSQPGQGTVIELRWPVDHRPSGQAQPSPPSV